MQINLDKTPPVIEFASPAANTLVSQANVIISGQVYDALSFVTATINGIDLGLLKDGSFFYSASLVVGINTFIVVAIDRADNRTTHELTVTYQEINNPPVALPINVVTLQDNPVEITLTASDEDGDDLNYFIVRQPEHGQLLGNGATLSYQPVANYYGLDNFDYVANDGSERSNVATVNVNVTKQLASMVISPPADIIVEATGQLTPVDIGVATATDATGAFTDVASDNSGPYPLGVTVVTWSAMDAAGLEVTAKQRITVQDTTPPQLTLLGPATVNMYCENSGFFDPGALANDIVDGNLTENIYFELSEFGLDVDINYFVSDLSGNFSSTTRTVLVSCVDYDFYRQAPIFTPNIGSIVVEAIGVLTPLPKIDYLKAYDHDDNPLEILGPFLSWDSQWNWSITNKPILAPELLPVGETYIEYIAFDNNRGLMSEFSLRILVEDTTAPQIILNGPSTVNLEAYSPYVELGASAFDIVEDDLTASIVTFGVVNSSVPGQYIITYQVQDTQYNVSQETRIVNVVSSVDITPPVVTPPSDILSEATAYLTSVTLGEATAVDDFDGILEVIPNTVGPFALGQHSVLWSAEDLAGNIGASTQTVSIVDTTPPVLIMPADITVVFGNTEAIVIGTAQATDIFPVSITNNATGTYATGSTAVLWKAVDANGNSTAATQVITVNASIAPTAVAGTDKTVSIDMPIVFDASSSYDPDGEIVGYLWKSNSVILSTEVAFIKTDLPLGEYVVSLTVTDNSGTMSSASITITVVDEPVQTMAKCRLDPIVDDRGFLDVYPDDNISYIGESYSDVIEIENAFNSARYQDQSVSRYLQMPEQNIWDAMSAQKKGLYLVNSERLARDIKPFEGTSQNIVKAAQDYAEHIRVNNQVIGHYNDGRSPQQRMDEDLVILNNRDAEIKSENAYATFATSLAGVGTSDERVVQAVYAYIYEDNYPLLGEAWGHRSSILQPGLLENSGIVGEEGLIGFGIAQGEYNPESNPYYPYGSIVVMNLVDSSDLAEYTGVETVDAASTLQCNDALNIELDQNLTLPPTLERLYISESQLVLVVGQSKYINVVAVLSDGSEQDVTHLVDFVPDNFSVVSINAGQVTGLVAGSVGITVSANGISSNRLIISVGEKTDTSNLTETDAEQYIPYIPDNASVILYNANTLTLLTGQVNDLYNVGLAGVSVSILNHADYGTTLTDNSGKFVVAVPAGNHVVSLTKAGYLSVQKNISAPSHSWGIVETTILQILDDKSTTIDLSSNTTQIHQSTPYTDLRGTRSTTLVFDDIGTATVTSADGTQRALGILSVSASEFTTPETMPGILPGTSAYTYCADLAVAGVADNESISFDNDVIMYVDNFLDFDIGEIVPIGYYDRLLGEWVGSKNGVVVELLDSDSDGLVDGVDYTGDGDADDVDGDGSSTDETKGIENYPVGGIYWRGAFNHFTPVDFNWSTSFGNDASQAEKFPIGTNESDEDDNECLATNSYVDIKSSAFHEDIAIPGTNFTLHYSSQRTEGYKHSINVRVSGDQIPVTLQEMVVKVEIAGVILEQKFLPQTNQEANFIWDGYNAVGEIERGEVNGVVKVGYAFPVNYNSNGNVATSSLTLDQFQQAWAKTGPNVTTVAGRQEGTLWTTQNITLYNAPESEIASGWSLSNQHVLTSSDKIYTGNGSVQDVVSASNVFKTGVVDSFVTGDDGFYQKPGKAIDYDVLTGDILRDNVTDLMWQYQNPQYFTSNQAAVNYCENLNLGDFTDWRLATLKEDTYTRSKGGLSSEVAIYSRSAPARWNTLTFNFPNAPQNILPVYCVRGEILDDKYIQNLERNTLDEVVVDKANGLMWQDDSSLLSTQGDWAFAINHCEALDKAGYNDWRLPNINEFMYVLPNNTFGNRFTFPPEPWARTHPDARPFWSSTPNVLNISNSWAIESEGYNSANYPQTDNNYVRCVRDDLSLARSPYLFNAAGKHIETIDHDTGSTLLTYRYDEIPGKLSSIVDLFGNQINLIRENGVLTAIESPDGLLTNLVVYDNDLIEVNYEDGSGYRFEYQSSLMTLEVDQNTNHYPHNYDAIGRVDYITDPENGVWTLHNTRDSLQGAKVYGYTTAEGRLYESQRIVENGLITKTTRNENGTTLLEAENTDTLITTTESAGIITVKTEEADQKTKKPRFSKQVTMLPSGLNLTLDTAKTYGNNGADFSKLTTSITLNNKTNTIVDDFKLGTKILNSAENRQDTIHYDPLTLLTISQQSGDIFATTYQYDSRGRTTLTTTGDRTSSYRYDAIGRGQLTASTDALNRTTRYEYDLLGRLSVKTLANGRAIHYSYDANGNLTGIIPPGKSEHVIEYNAVDDESQYTPPSVWQINTPYTQYRYNHDRELTQIIRPDLQVIDYTYNNLAQVTAVDTPGGEIQYSYNSTTGNIERITAPDGNTLSYLYDGLLNTQTSWAGGINANVLNTYNNDFVITQREINGGHAINFARDNDLLLIQAGALNIHRNISNGLISDTTIDNSTSAISYNDYGEVDSYSARYNGTMQYHVTYQYDLVGRISQKQEIIEGVTSLYDYSYDQGGKLESVSIDGSPVATYTYDSNGNRTHVNGVPLGEYDAQDRLTQYGATQYHYTDNGELQQASNSQTGETKNYRYDVLGNLMQVTLPDNTRIDYLIDGQNRRIGKKVNGNLTQGFVYKDQLNPIAELDGNNQIITRFIYATKANVPDYMIKGDARYRIISDHLGSPRLVINTQTGNVAQRIDYDTWGNIITDTNPGLQPFGFAGGIYDQHTRLTRFGARDYDGATGRWTAKDPIRFSGGDTNLYGYTSNDPINFTDENGLWSVSVGAYLGVGGSINIAYKNGTLETSGRIGVGLGGGATFDPLGEPSPHSKVTGSGHIARTSVEGGLAFGAGPFSIGATGQGSSGNAVTTPQGGGFTTGSVSGLSSDGKWAFGFKFGGSVGVDIGGYTNWGRDTNQCK